VPAAFAQRNPVAISTLERASEAPGSNSQAMRGPKWLGLMLGAYLFPIGDYCAA
jgi:hypothetical protein